MNRRGFLASMLALGAAPAIVRASSLMKIVVPSTEEIIGLTGAIDCTTFSEEMSAIMRRVWIPTMAVQIYNNSPLMASLLADVKIGAGGYTGLPADSTFDYAELA